MTHFAIVFTKEKYQFGFGIDKESITEVTHIAQYADEADVTPPNMTYFYFYEYNVKQEMVFREAMRLMNEHFLSILK